MLARLIFALYKLTVDKTQDWGMDIQDWSWTIKYLFVCFLFAFQILVTDFLVVRVCEKIFFTFLCVFVW